MIYFHRSPFSALLCSTFFFALSAAPFSVKGAEVIINEVLASNGNVLADEDGDYEDWIELHNAGDEAVNLSGWGLSDDYERPFRWVFPRGSGIEAGETLLIWASGKDRTDPSGELHTNYSIAAAGEEVILTDPDGTRVDELPPTAIPRNISMGRVPGEGDTWFFFDEPTPGSPNTTTAYSGLLDPPAFSRSGGTFHEPFALELTSPVPGAQVRYTTDGSVPEAHSPLYSGPILVSETVQVRARAFAPGHLPSLPLNEVFIQLDPSLEDFTSNLPLIVIHNFSGGDIPKSPVTLRQFAGIAVFEPGEDGRSSLTSPAALATRTGINIRGSSTKNFPKSNYRLEFWDELGDGEKGRDHPLLDMPAEEDWVLYAPNQFDLPLIHNPFAYSLSNDVGRYAPRHRFVEVFVNTSGGVLAGPVPSAASDYRGVYVLVENIKRGPDRVDIESLNRGEEDPEEITGGYLFKIDRQGPDERSFTTAGMNVIYRYPKGIEMKTESRRAQADYVRDYFDDFYAALTGRDPGNAETGYPAYIDVDSWIDHHLLNVLPMNVDALRLSAHFHKRRGEKLEMGPIWDFDRSLGTSRGDGRPFNPRTWRALSGDRGTDYFNQAGNFRNAWYGELFRQIDFWQSYVDRYQELRDSVFSEEHLFGLVDSLATPLMEAQAREVARWGGQGPSNTRPRSGSVSHNGYTHQFPGTYEGELDFMKRWLGDRVAFMDSNFLPRPEFSQPGRELIAGETVTVALEGPEGSTLYYTLDGSDPRLPGGEVAGFALPYSEPIAVEPGTKLIARALDRDHRNLTGGSNPPRTTPWSGLSRVSFPLTPPQIGKVPDVVETVAVGEPVSLDANTFFSVTGEDTLTFTAQSSSPNVGEAGVEGNILTLTGLRQGETRVSVDAHDGQNAPVSVSFRMLVYPEPFALAQGNFVFDEWSPEEPAGSYPDHMIFLQSDRDDPGLAAPLEFAYAIPESDSFQERDVYFPYSAERRTRINALGKEGISFINTGRERDAGAAFLALDTRGASEIDVSWTGGTVQPNSRIYALRLQYRLSFEDPWLDLPDKTGEPVEYVRSSEAGDVLRLGPVRLPGTLQHQPYVQLQWRYYHISETSGPRAELRLDDILVSAASKSYSTWVNRVFPDPADRNDPEVAGPDVDPIGAGIPNLLRYALDMDAEDVTRSQLPRLEMEEGRLSLRFRRDPAKPDIAYLVEVSSSIADWGEVLYDSRINPGENNEEEFMRILDTVPLTEAGGNRFLRLRIELLK
ncbi:MAG: CotH kinase family protein [Opitutales bacterium]